MSTKSLLGIGLAAGLAALAVATFNPKPTEWQIENVPVRKLQPPELPEMAAAPSLPGKAARGEFERLPQPPPRFEIWTLQGEGEPQATRSDNESERFARAVPASLTALASLSRGDRVLLPLPGGTPATGKLNLVQRASDGVLRMGGELPEATGGSFSLAMRDNQIEGVVLLPEQEIACTITNQSDGALLLREKPLAEVICFPLPRMEGEPAASPPLGAIEAPPVLSSRPEATAVLYLDFDGETVTDPSWNGGNTVVAEASPLTSAQIIEVWHRVKEDFWPFAIDVTTDVNRYHNAPVGRRMRCIITPTDTAYPGVGGVAYVNSFSRAGALFSSTIPCWVFNRGVVGIAEAVSHELGHTLGLLHDGRTSPAEVYYYGHGIGPVGWAPIMGVGYYQPVVQWSKGEYLYANNQEDDLAIIGRAQNGFGFVPDDAGDTRDSAVLLNAPEGQVNQVGVISSDSDVDYYLLLLSSSGLLSLSAKPASVAPNLDILIELQDSTGAVLAASNPDLEFGAGIVRNLEPGTYYLKVQGTGRGDVLGDGYSSYGSIGHYSLTGTLGEILINGGFESDYTGWARWGNQQISSRASEGVKAVQFNSGQTSPDGVLTQGFATTPGQGYTIAMNVGADWGTPSTQQRLQITLQGSSTLLSETVVVFGTGNSSSKYISTNFTFVADSTSTTLTFRDVSTTGLNVDLLLDNVRVTVALPVVTLYSPASVVGEHGPAIMHSSRRHHTATLLADGKLLVAGGGDHHDSLLAQAELYDPATGTWSLTGSLVTPRRLHQAVLMADGRVLIAGGLNGTIPVGWDELPLSSAEVFDPATGMWSATASMSSVRYHFAMALLPDGRVLVAGGMIDGGPRLASSEVYDPVSGTWTPTGSLNFPRSGPSTTLLANGKVLVAGGFNGTDMRTAELYDPVSGAWEVTGSMNKERVGHTATLLGNGVVLVAGGVVDPGGAELYDPVAGTWSRTGSLHHYCFSHTATLLTDGRVLVTGGTRNGATALFASEIYDPAAGAWSKTESLISARYDHTATLVAGGAVLVVGGYEYDGSGRVSIPEFYDPGTGAWMAMGAFTFRRSGSTGEFLQVNFSSSGTATSGADYTDLGDSVVFRSGEPVALLPVSIVADQEVEPNETVVLRLEPGANYATGTSSSARMTILDNTEPGGTVEFKSATYAVAENEGSVRVYATRTGASSGPASVVYATADETAIAGQDYTAVSGTLNWAAGDTVEKFFDVPIIDDSSSDGDQTFTLRLSGATGATLGSPNATVITISGLGTRCFELQRAGPIIGHRRCGAFANFRQPHRRVFGRSDCALPDDEFLC